MKTIKQIHEAHKFFIRETQMYVGIPEYGWLNEFIQTHSTSENLRKDVAKHYKLTIKQKLYYPIAYIKFMYSFLFDN